MSRRSVAILVVFGWLLTSSGAVFALHLADCQGDHQKDQCPTCQVLISGRAATLDLDGAIPPPAPEASGEHQALVAYQCLPAPPHLGSIALRAPPPC